jgi:exodeoxyribonuclease VIII
MQPMITTPEFSIETMVDQLMKGEMRLSYSALSAFKESPAKFIEYKTRQKVTTDAMIFGSMVHCLILEPEDFNNRYFTFDDSEKTKEVGGEKPRATKAYKEWKAVTMAEAGDRVVVDPGDFASAQIIAQNIANNRAAAKVLRLCPRHEKPIEWEYKNFKFHGFIDGDGDEATFDLKICADASPRKFLRTIYEMDYHMQGAMYQCGNDRVKRHYMIAADRSGGVSVHLLHDKLIEKGMEEYDRLVGKFNECILSDGWDQSFDFWSERYDGIYSAEPATWMF